MITSLARTFTMYILLIFIMRVTGKRQIGELEISELVSTILISEIASAPISEHKISLYYAIMSILLIVSLEVVISFIITRSSLAKRIFIGSPSILIKRGELQPSELSKARMSVEELLCQIRINGYTTIEDVNYAIMENDGTISIIPKAYARPPSSAEMSMQLTESGIAHAVIVDGVIKKEALSGSGKSFAWLKNEIEKSGTNQKNIFLMTVDDANHVYIIKRKDRGGSI